MRSDYYYSKEDAPVVVVVVVVVVAAAEEDILAAVAGENTPVAVGEVSWQRLERGCPAAAAEVVGSWSNGVVLLFCAWLGIIS